MNDQDNDFGLICPQCKTGDQIDIQAAVWVRLCPDGTDVTAAENGDHEWEDDDRALCAACGHEGTVKFAISGWPGLQAG
jgi:RecJ-like exonuclease